MITTESDVIQNLRHLGTRKKNTTKGSADGATSRV
jgi:hypothetical protein